MSVKPLDLQVNVNGTLEVGKMQAELQARNANLQSDKDAKAIEEQKANQEKIQKSMKGEQADNDAKSVQARDQKGNSKNKKREKGAQKTEQKSSPASQKKPGSAIDFTA